MIPDTTLLNRQNYKVCIKGKVEQSREGIAPSPTPWWSSYWKGSLRVMFDWGRQLYFIKFLPLRSVSYNRSTGFYPRPSLREGLLKFIYVFCSLLWVIFFSHIDSTLLRRVLPLLFYSFVCYFVESEWQQASASLQDTSQYSNRSQQFSCLDGLN